jgi:response regulator RpfG family c-di-GMP phosphodiesterase
MANPITCLVVDDEAAVRTALAKGLKRDDFLCLQAGSGREALEIIERQVPEIMISDLRMPVMDGVALLEHVHQQWPDIAVLVASAVAEVDTAVACLQKGAMDYITKPFQLDEVRARVEQALEKRRLILENRRYQNHLAELVRQQAARIEELFLQGVQTLVEALEANDAYTHGHSSRVGAYAGKTARELALSDSDVMLIELGAELHDVGKIGVREAVLLKRGSLTSDEYKHLMRHTTIGERILEPLLSHVPEVLAVVRSHHERIDGSGLPDGLSGDEIPLPARVVAVCDAFDAMTSDRPYRDALPSTDALDELERLRGVQFDRTVVAAFSRAHPDPAGIPIATPPKVLRRVPKSAAGAGVPVSAP